MDNVILEFKHTKISLLDRKLSICVIDKESENYKEITENLSSYIKSNIKTENDYSIEDLNNFGKEIDDIIDELKDEKYYKRSKSDHNYDLYSSFIKNNGITDELDVKYLSNKFGNLYKKFNCIDNYRVCLSNKDKQMSEKYVNILSNGCCGFYDRHIYNDVTKNYFYIGFNYVH